MTTSVPAFDAAAIRAVAFDLDGTLADTLGDFHAAISAMLVELSLPPIARETVSSFVGKGTEHLLHSVLACVAPSAHRTPEDTQSLYAAAWGHYMRHYEALNGQHTALYPGVLEGLARLRAAGLPLACVTNKPEGFARTLLARKDIADCFSVVAGGDTYERKKPDPMPLVGTARLLGVAPQALLMVGDSVNDAQAARAAGCPVVLVPYGYNHGVPVDGIDADGVVPDLDTLAQALRPAR
ncbi:phosphoglycolate phosphatase [Comamonadaceae bacterium PP-2]